MLKTMRMEFPAGDTKTLDFDDVVVNGTVDPRMFVRLNPRRGVLYSVPYPVADLLQGTRVFSGAVHRRVGVLPAVGDPLRCGRLVAAASVGLRRVTFDSDVISLLPRDGRAVPAFRTFLRRFGSLDQLLVVFTAPDGQSIADYSEEI